MASQDLIPEGPSGSNENPRHEDTPPRDDEEEFEQMNFLTQYIGHPKRPNDRRPATDDRNYLLENQIDKKKEEFRTKYLELVEVYDRAASHRESLQRSLERHRTPFRLKINVQPMIIEKDHPDFISRWDRAIKQCEEKLLQTLIDHLDSFMEKTNLEIRATTKQAFLSLKTIQPSGAKETIQETLEEAQMTRTEKTEARKKRKAEKAAEAQNKKSKKD